jgi:hypothetical protein
MAIFSFNQDFPYSIGPLPNYNWRFLNIPTVQPKRTEISADMDIETISDIISDKMIEFIKKSFEAKAPNVVPTNTLPVVQLKRTEMSADMDIETISDLISDKMIEFIKKSFETTLQKVSKSDNLVVLHPFLLQDINRI